MINDCFSDNNGRFIVMDISVKHQRFTLVSLYGYNTDEQELYNDIYNKITLYKNSCLILCGDWNFVQDMDIDTYNIIHDRHVNCKKVVQNIKDTYNLIDPWRTCNPNSRQYTWRQHSPLKQSRIDYFFNF